MERFGGGRLESVDMFADNGENVGNTGYGDDEDMFNVEDDLELVKALEQTGELNNEMEFEEESCPPPPAATPLETLPGFDLSAGRTWIYPCNMSHRSYQFDIVQSCLYNNTLVCLPTGLGKTFIAAVVMYNFYRWYPQGKIVFMAPTKPLVGQQIEACFKIMGIPQDDTKEMTGSVAVSERTKAWASKRVFFLTPQVMSNDLSRGLFPAKEVKLLIVDEAHKAQGEYAYCLVARELGRAKAMTRIVALSATPGTDIPNVKAMLQNLFISHIELRHEESPDIVPYTHTRVVDKIVIPMDRNILDIKDKLLGVMEIYTKRLSAASAIRKGHNPSAYSKYVFLSSRTEWRQNPPANLASHLKGQVEGDYAACIKLYHGMELVTTQGLRSFYNFFTKETEADFSSKRIRGELSRIPLWRDILAIITEKFSGDVSNSVLNQAGPVLSQAGSRGQMVQKTATSHPKMDRLLVVVQEHFVKYAKEGMETRVIIFSQFRDCVTELVACLASLKPTVRPMPFIGQAGAAGKKGLTQKEQIEVVRRFKEGGYNTLVATCVGEEGLDIGEVDLIVLYDVARSPIRLVQRMGRTGRKREGRIVVLVTEGQEERVYNQSLHSKKTIHEAILDKERLEHVLYTQAPRMVPLGVEPVCHRMKMIVGTWKGKYDGKGAGQGVGIQGFTKKVAKDDIFRQNCGFLTEAEEERWRRDVRWEGRVKMVRTGMESWAGKGGGSDSPTKQRDFFNLGEFSLWQTGEQYRRCVGSSNVSSTYRRIMEMMGDKGAMQRRMEASQISRSKLDVGRGAAGRGNNILKYFKPSQNKSVSQATPVKLSLLNKSGQESDIVILETINEDDVFEHVELDQSGNNLSHFEPPSVPPKEILYSSETSLLEALLDDQDSGVSSLPPSPSSPPSLQRLLDFPPTIGEGKLFDVAAAVMKAKLRIEGRNTGETKEEAVQLIGKVFAREDLVVMPVEKNESLEDMFADDSLFGDINCEEMEKENNPVPVTEKPQGILAGVDGDQTANFDLESPVISPAMLDPPPEDVNSQFDLGGSPVMLEDDMFEVEPIQAVQLPKLSLLSKLRPGVSSNTSTPLPGNLTIPSGPDLTPVHPVTSRSLVRLQDSPLQLKPAPAVTREVAVATSGAGSVASSKKKLSDDMFGDEESDEEIFNNLVTNVDGRGEISKTSSKSVFSATQLVSMVNKSDIGVVGHPSSSGQGHRGHNQLTNSSGKSPVGSRKKLSNLFDEFIDDIEPNIYDDEHQFKTQMKLAIEASLKSSQKDSRNEAEAVDAVFDLSDIEFSQEFINNEAKDVEPKGSDILVNTETVQKNSQEAFSEDMFENDIIEEAPKPTENNPKNRKDCQSKSSEDSINLLQDKQPSSSSRLSVVPSVQPSPTTALTAPPPPCPVCDRPVTGDMNKHLDECLNGQIIDELTQRGGEVDGPPTGGPSQIREERGGKEMNRMLDMSSSSDDSPVVRGGRGRVLASQSQLAYGSTVEMGRSWKGEESDDSPVGRGRGVRARVMASQSVLRGEESDDSPVRRGRGGRARVMASQSVGYLTAVTGDQSDDSLVERRAVMASRSDVDNTDSSDGLKVIRKKKGKAKKNVAANGFIEVEAEVSGESGGSDDDEEGSQDRYDESFVDDASQATDTAVYLRSVRSPEFRRPQQRVLPPITDDIFSQAVGRDDNEDSYAEDSFCVGSQVEWDTGMDTLDMLERRAEGGRGETPAKRKRSNLLDNGKSKKRKRIIAPASDDETIVQIPDDSPDKLGDDEMAGVNFDDFDSSFPIMSQSLLTVNDDIASSRDDLMFLQPDFSTSMAEVEKLSIIISSTEVNKVPEVISSLKHIHQLNVSIRSCEAASFIVSQNFAVHRVSEMEFSTGTMKDKLVQRVRDSREQYSKTTLIVEWEKVKPGDKPKSGARTKQMDLIVGQLAMAGVVVMYSTGQLQTATILAELVQQENKEGLGLPRPVRLTVWQEEMVKWIQLVPGMGLASAIQLSMQFNTLRELVTANISEAMGKGRLDRRQAEGMVNFFIKTFQPELTDLAPL